MSVLKKQVTEIHREANVLLRERRPDILIDRELSAEANRVIVKNPECSRSKENLACLCVWYGDVRLKEPVRMFSDELTKKPPVPLVWWSAPFWWAIAIHQTVVEYIGTLVPVVLGELRVGAPDPKVIAARRHTTHHADHGARNVCGLSDSLESRLRTGDGETGEGRAFKAGANLRSPVLEAPRDRSVEIIPGLNPGRRKRGVSNNSRKGHRKRQVRGEPIRNQFSN